MSLVSREPYFFWILLLISLLAWKIQTTLFLNYDVSWLLEATRRMLAGGTYARDFFETNPPLILYLYLPPVMLSKLSAIPLPLLFRGYLFLLACLSLGLCSYLVKKIFQRTEGLISTLFLLTLAVIFLILPCHDFGQRDHLLIILSLPYFLLMVCRLQKIVLPYSLALILGFVAALGFSIKPHFLIAPLLIEIYYGFYTKNLKAWLRPESLMILLIVSLYVGFIFLFYPDYLYIIVPYSLRLYYSGVSQPWTALALNPVALFCLIPIIFYCFSDQKNFYPYLNLSRILFLGLLGFFLAYFAQRMTHYYHLIPVFSFALLLLLIEMGSLYSSGSRRWPEGVFAAFLALLLFTMPLGIFYKLYVSSLNYKKATLKQLTNFLNEYARKELVYFFVTAGSYAFPTLDYTATKMAPRFYFLWMAAGLANQSLALGQASLAVLEQYRRDKNFLINMVADDLYQYKPRYIFIDQSKEKYRIQDKNFDYLAYFLGNAKFQQEWQHYRYFTTLEVQGAYKLSVYSRKKS